MSQNASSSQESKMAVVHMARDLFAQATAGSNRRLLCSKFSPQLMRVVVCTDVVDALA